jgi:hypothetical protein
MAGKGKPGPAKGEGGRPRKPAGEGKARADGYKRRTVGAKGNRAVAYGGNPPKSSKSAKSGIVDHKDQNKRNNSKSNLRKTTKSQNNKNR